MNRAHFPILISALLVVAAACGTPDNSSIAAAPAADTKSPAVDRTGLPTRCAETPADLPVFSLMDFSGAVLASNAVSRVTVTSVDWRPNTARGVHPAAGYLVIQGRDAQSGLPATVFVSTWCNDAAKDAAAFEAAAAITVMTKDPSDLQRTDGIDAPVAFVIWSGGDWEQPVYGMSPEGLATFEAYAKSLAVEPLDLVAQWVSSERRDALRDAYLAWEESLPWHNTDPFIRSLSAGDMPPDVLAASTMIEGQVSYSREVLERLAADPLSRVVVRTQDGVLGAAAVRDVGEFQWRAQLPTTATLITVWVSHTGDLTGGVQVGELRLTPAQHTDGAQILVTITDEKTATIEPVK